MGKFIEFKSKYDLDIGTELWAVGKKTVRKYKPCPVCNNGRTIKVHDNNGNEYDMPCPRCTGLQTKGGESEDFKQYKAAKFRIMAFELAPDYRGKYAQRIKLSAIEQVSRDCYVDSTEIVDSENLLTEKYWESGEPTQFYISEEEAKAEAKRLNTEQAALIKAFLESEDIQNGGD